MFKKIVKVISVAAVLATTAIAAGPKCTIYTFLDQGKNYMKNITSNEIFGALNNSSNSNKSNINKYVEEKGVIAGIRKGAAQRIKDDLALSSMTLNLKDMNGQTFTINLQDATLNTYKYFYIHLYNILKNKDANYQQQFAAAAIDMSDFMYFISKYYKFREGYKNFARAVTPKMPLKSVPFMSLVLLREAANLKRLSYNQQFFGPEFGSIATGIVRGYIVVQRNGELRKYIPKDFLDFAFYVITGNFRKADKIVLKEIQKDGGFAGIMQYCLIEQLKYKNR